MEISLGGEDTEVLSPFCSWSALRLYLRLGKGSTLSDGNVHPLL